MPTTDPLFDIAPDPAGFKKGVESSSSMPTAIAQHVLWHFGDANLGLQPGTFVERLLLTLSAADKTNRDLLAQVYPDYVKAFRAVQNEHWGLEWLRGIARPAPKAAAGVTAQELGEQIRRSL